MANASATGYWLASTSGDVFPFNAVDHGHVTTTLNGPVTGIAATPSYGGYWLTATDGGVFNYGNAGFYGSAGGVNLAAQVVAIIPTADGAGYWLVGADGGVFNYGDAGFWGSMPGAGINITDVIGGVRFSNGYCLGEADGYAHCFDSQYQGSNNITLHVAALSMYTDPGVAIIPNSYDYYGFWLVDRTGQVWAWQATGTSGLSVIPTGPITGGSSWGGAAYRFDGADGGVFDFGGLAYEGGASVSSELSATAAQHYGHVVLPQGNWGGSVSTADASPCPTSAAAWNGDGQTCGGYAVDGLYQIWEYIESGWLWNAGETTISCGGSNYPYGIPQACPGSKMCNTGLGQPACPSSSAWQTNAWSQIDWGFYYICGCTGGSNYDTYNGVRVSNPVEAYQYDVRNSGYAPVS